MLGVLVPHSIVANLAITEVRRLFRTTPFA